MKTPRWRSLIRAVRVIRSQFVFWLRFCRAVPVRNWKCITARRLSRFGIAVPQRICFRRRPRSARTPHAHCSKSRFTKTAVAAFGVGRALRCPPRRAGVRASPPSVRIQYYVNPCRTAIRLISRLPQFGVWLMIIVPVNGGVGRIEQIVDLDGLHMPVAKERVEILPVLWGELFQVGSHCSQTRRFH